MAASLEVRLPYLTRNLLSVADRWAGRQPVGPGGSKAPLRRVAYDVFPASIAARVIDRAKEPAPANSARVTERLARYAADVVPHEHAERHPLGHLPSFARAGRPLGVLLLDLFVAIFLVHRADPPPDFGPEQLYGSHAERRALQDALEAIGSRTAERR
jgi:hypothetical protein